MIIPCLFYFLLVEIWVLPGLGLSTLLPMDFGAHGHTFPPEISMRIDLLCHTVCIYLTLVDNAKLFPKVYYQFTGSPKCLSKTIGLYLHQRLILLVILISIGLF